MKKESFKDLTAVELQAKGRDMRQELFNLRLQQASSQLEKPSRMRELRKSIARVETQLVNAGFHGFTRQKRRIAATIIIGLDGFEMAGAVVLDTVEVDVQPAGWFALCGIQHMGRQSAGFLRVRLHIFSRTWFFRLHYPTGAFL